MWYAFRRLLLIVVAGGAVAVLTACSSDEEMAPVTKISSQYAARGAGGTFALAVYTAWAEDLNTLYSAPLYAFRGVGRAEGLAQFIAGDADFGASAVALDSAAFDTVGRPVLNVPMTAGLLSLAYNLGEVEAELKFSRQLYTAILSGEVTRWDDPQIVELNPGIALPAEAIELIVREPGSGMSEVLSTHLGRISEQWAKKYPIPSGPISWPASAIRVITDQNVAETVAGRPYSLGYVDYAVARQMELGVARLQNKAGRYPAPGIESGQRALEEAVAGEPGSLVPDITDPEHPSAYPLVVLSSVFFHDVHPDGEERSKAIRLWLAHGLADEQQRIASTMGYIPLPGALLEASREAARAQD